MSKVGAAANPSKLAAEDKAGRKDVDDTLRYSPLMFFFLVDENGV